MAPYYIGEGIHTLKITLELWLVELENKKQNEKGEHETNYIYLFGLWCLMPLSTIFQLYRGCQFYLWRKLEYQEKTTDLMNITTQESTTCLRIRRICLSEFIT